MKKIAIFASGSGSNAEKICAFLNKEPHASLSKVIKNEIRDTKFISGRKNKENQIYKNINDKTSFEKLLFLSKTYEQLVSS